MPIPSATISPRNRERSILKKFCLARLAGMLLLVCAATSASHAQTYTLLASFGGFNGELPQASLVQGVNGDFFGTTMIGGGNPLYGTVFKMTPAGLLITIYDFCAQPNCTDGWQPESGLTLGANGNFYGTTTAGGKILGTCLGPGCGTVFEITPAGKLTTLHSFCSEPKCTDGAVPRTSLVLGYNGNFYGTTSTGGANGEGTIFEITPAGKLTTLYSFCSLTNCADGSYPITSLVQADDGNLYGTTYDGGAIVCPYFNNTYGCGTIFKITPSGQLTTLYSFGTDAGLLQEALAQANNGNFYGTSPNGGTGLCSYGCGTVFEITSSGALTTLYNFCTQEFCPDGAYPMAGLVLATDGKLYGSTTTGGLGVGEGGTIFSVTPAGALSTVYNLGGTATGYSPAAPLAQATDGKLYGTTNGGGASNLGTIFSLSIGVGPFVEAVPVFGNVGAKVLVLGNNLTDATAVSFNGTPASFTVASNTEIEATVPTGATSGRVVVSTPARSLESNTVFRVAP